MMYTEQEVEYGTVNSYGMSQLVGDKVRQMDGQSEIPNNINCAQFREKLINFLSQQSDEYLQEIGLKIANTEGVHDVTFGRNKIGDFYFCDLLSSLYDFSRKIRVLDFGCSSGRIIRNLNAVYNIEAYGCDPRANSIAFNIENFKGINWFVSNQRPPLTRDVVLGNTRFDLVFAVSVWSHFSEEMALYWFKEFAERVAPGGRLIFSTHGFRSIYHFETVLRKMPRNRAIERLESLRRDKFHFAAYPKGGDLDEQHWGMAFIPPNWVKESLSGAWEVEAYHPGLAMKNQDVYVLKRR